IKSALEQARRAAGGKDISLSGGASVTQQYLAAGLVDEMEINLVPTLLGSGERLFEGVGDDLHGLRLVKTVATPAVTHLRFKRDARISREQLLRSWNAAWDIALNSIEALSAEDLDRTIRIRNEELLVVEALNRSVTHTAYHVGQIVYLARHFASPNWKTLSIPKRRSAEAGSGAIKR